MPRKSRDRHIYMRPPASFMDPFAVPRSWYGPLLFTGPLAGQVKTADGRIKAADGPMKPVDGPAILDRSFCKNEVVVVRKPDRSRRIYVRPSAIFV